VSEMQRYDLEYVGRAYMEDRQVEQVVVAMVQREDGEWVRAEDCDVLIARVAELEDALAVAQAEVAVERGRVADLMTMNVGLAAIVKDLKARLAALEDDLRQAAEVEVER